MKQFSGTIKFRGDKVAVSKLTFADFTATFTGPVMRKMISAAVLGAVAFGGINYLNKAADKALDGFKTTVTAPYATAEKIANDELRIVKKMAR